MCGIFFSGKHPWLKFGNVAVGPTVGPLGCWVFVSFEKSLDVIHCILDIVWTDLNAAFKIEARLGSILWNSRTVSQQKTQTPYEQKPKRFMQKLYLRGPMVENESQTMENDMANYLKR